jgi:hypothetical protein
MTRSTRILPRLATIAALTTVVGVTHLRVAHAGGKDDLLAEAGAQLGKYYALVLELKRSPTSGDELPSAAQCEADVKAWRAKGVGDADRIFSYDFNQHPKAKDKPNTIPMSEMPAVCAAYAPLYAAYKLDFDLRALDGVLMRVRDKFVKPGDSVLTSTVIDWYETTGDPKTCAAAVVAARQADPKRKIDTSVGALTLDEYETKVCGELAAIMPGFVKDARAALAKAQQEAAAPLVAAGIAGDKLALLAKYQGLYWRLKGGDRTDDPKKLAAASVLFQWLEAPDPADPEYVIHTIRKYTFKGNAAAGTSEKTYRKKKGVDLPAKAFK